MLIQAVQRLRFLALTLGLLIPGVLLFALPGLALADSGKTKVLYHVDGDDVNVAKYAMALINKHIEAEGGPDKIDVVLVVHGPTLKLFEKETTDSVLREKLNVIVHKGAKAEMCPGAMKLFGLRSKNSLRVFNPPSTLKRVLSAIQT